MLKGLDGAREWQKRARKGLVQDEASAGGDGECTCRDAVLSKVKGEETNQEVIEASEARKATTRSNDFNYEVIDQAEKQGIEYEPDLAQA